MSNETKQVKKKKKNSELLQLLLSVFIIGIFVMIEVWLIFFYCSRYGYDNSTFLFPLIFGVLTILMVCINTLNIYQIFIRRVSGGGSDKKAEFMIYKQVKSLPDTFKAQLEELNVEFEKTQKKTAKAILIKVDEQLKQMKEELATQQSGDSGVADQIAAIKADVDDMKSQLSELKDRSENISNMLSVASVDHEKISEQFPQLQNEHKKVFDLLGSLAFRNDEIKSMLDNLTKIEQEMKSEIENAGPVVENVEEVDDTENLSSEVNIEEISLDDLFVTAEPDTIAEEIPEPEVEAAPEEGDQESENSFPEVSGDPNKQLTPEEIAALFANV